MFIYWNINFPFLHIREFWIVLLPLCLFDKYHFRLWSKLCNLMGNARSLWDCYRCCYRCCNSHDVAAQKTLTDPAMAGPPSSASEAGAQAGQASASEAGGPPPTSPVVIDTSTEQASTCASAVADEACQNILDISKYGVDGDLSALINYTGILLDYAKESRSSSSKDSKPQRKEWKFVDTTDLVKFKDMFSESADAARSLISNEQRATVMDVAKTVLNGIGKAHWVAAGLLVVTFVLERFEMVSANNAECVDVLDEMYRLAEYLQILKQRRTLKQHISSLMEEALQLVVEGAAVCFCQAKSSWLYKFFGANVEKRQLEDVRRRLEKTHKHLMLHVILRVYDSNQPPQLPRMEFYPHQAVIQSETLTSIVEMLELESQKKVLVVVLHGLGGIGKSTLAHAVYARVDDALGFKFSKAALYENTESKPNTIAVQRKILAAISENPVTGEPSTSSDGQNLLLKYFEKEPCFVYIDNVLDGIELGKLLPSDLDRSRKLRLLLTARDTTVRNGVDVKNRNDVKFFSVESLEEKDAETLLKKQMGTDVAEQISQHDLQYLLSICGGMPLLIELVGRYLRYYDNNVAEALKAIRDERRYGDGQHFGGQSIEFFSFAFDTLQQSWRDAFLDICAFSLGFYSSYWDWRFLERLFGKHTMEVLQRRALVKKVPLEYTPGVMIAIEFEAKAKVHDVVLEMGRRIGQSSRIATVSQFRSMLESTDPNNLRNIKGIFLQEKVEDGEHLILPSHKLDAMSASLRILYTDYDTRNRPYPVIEIEGECKEAFPNLLYWDSGTTKSQPPHGYGKRCPELRALMYAPTSTVLLQQLPSNLKELFPRFEHESIITDTEKLVIVEPVSQMLNIEVLCLAGKYLREIPAGLISHMKSLGELSLADADQLVQLPDELHTLPHLHTICFSDIALREVPESIGGCVLLKRLTVRRCREVVRLPLGIENLSLLQELNLRGCESLEELPENIGRLTSLKFLCLWDCRNLKRLGATFHSLPSLEILDLDDCSELEANWMDVLTDIKSLQFLYIRNCPRLIQRWQELENADLNVKCKY